MPAIPKRSLVSWEYRKPLWPEVFLSNITSGDAGAAQRVWSSWHSLPVHTTISGILTSHTPFSPPSKRNWRAKGWDFSKGDPKCDNSWRCVEQLTQQHLGLGGFTFQQEKNKKGGIKPRAPKTELVQHPPKIDTKNDTKTSSDILLAIFSPILLPLPFPSPPLLSQNLSAEDWAKTSQFRRTWGKPKHVACTTVKLSERAFFLQIKPSKPDFLGKSLCFCCQVVTWEKWSCSLLYFCHSARYQDGRRRISSLEKPQFGFSSKGHKTFQGKKKALELNQPLTSAAQNWWAEGSAGTFLHLFSCSWGTFHHLCLEFLLNPQP